MLHNAIAYPTATPKGIAAKHLKKKRRARRAPPRLFNIFFEKTSYVEVVTVSRLVRYVEVRGLCFLVAAHSIVWWGGAHLVLPPPKIRIVEDSVLSCCKYYVLRSLNSFWVNPVIDAFSEFFLFSDVPVRNRSKVSYYSRVHFAFIFALHFITRTSHNLGTLRKTPF